MMASLRIFFCGLLLVAPLWADPVLPVGSEAPRFLLLDNSSNQRLGLKDWIGEKAPRGKPLLLLNFWSLSCVPCLEEMPFLDAFAAQNSAEVAVVFVNLDDRKQSSAVAARVKQLRIQSTVLLDPYQVTGKNYNVCSAQGACNVPALFGINAQGAVVLAQAGFEGSQVLESRLNALLQQAQSRVFTPAPDKNLVLRQVLQSASLDSIAALHQLSKAELISILNEAESAARARWK